MIPQFKPKIKLQLKDEMPITAFSYDKRQNNNDDIR